MTSQCAAIVIGPAVALIRVLLLYCALTPIIDDHFSASGRPNYILQYTFGTRTGWVGDEGGGDGTTFFRRFDTKKMINARAVR